MYYETLHTTLLPHVEFGAVESRRYMWLFSKHSKHIPNCNLQWQQMLFSHLLLHKLGIKEFWKIKATSSIQTDPLCSVQSWKVCANILCGTGHFTFNHIYITLCNGDLMVAMSWFAEGKYAFTSVQNVSKLATIVALTM